MTLYIPLKVAFYSINHKKIVQKIFKSYIPKFRHRIDVEKYVEKYDRSFN